MDEPRVVDSYSGRAEEYTQLFGSIEAMNPLDIQAIDSWAKSLSGEVVDAGCGPGHWTDYLHQQGLNVVGIDIAPAFIEQATQRFPDVSFRVCSLLELDVPDASIDGVLAWYSLIHLTPEVLPLALAEFARALRPGGQLMIGFFVGESGAPFDHKVTTAYFWSLETLASLLREAGFAVVSSENRLDPNVREHGAISAVLRDPAEAKRL